MVITLDPALQAALEEHARRRGVAPDAFALRVLRERLMLTELLQPRDEWERGLVETAVDCGISLPNSALGSEGLYE